MCRCHVEWKSSELTACQKAKRGEDARAVYVHAYIYKHA